MYLTPFTPHPYETLTPKLQEFFPQAVYEAACKQLSKIQDTVFERITYESDTLTITGALGTPRDIADGCAPIIIFCRGGYGDYGILTAPVMLRMFHRFTQRGFIVIGSNYRGNDGSDGRDDFGGDDARDVVALREQLQHVKGWDGRNVFLLGWSRGGMMAYRALQLGIEVNAAASIAGIADVHVLAKESPHLEKRILARLSFANGDAGTIAHEYNARSAVHWAGDIQAPLLLLHGDADADVSATHSIALAEKLSETNTEHRLHIFPEGDHTLKRFKNETDDMVVDWFTTYLT